MTCVDLMKKCSGSLEDFIKQILDEAGIDDGDTRDKVSDKIKSCTQIITTDTSTKKEIKDVLQEETDKKENTLDDTIDTVILAGTAPVPPVLSGSGGSNFTKSSLKPKVTTEGIVIRNKKAKTKVKAENAKTAHISPKQDYPNSSTHIDPLGNFVKINKKTGQVDIAHFSGTIIQITKSGSVNIHTKKDFKHIVEGNYILEVKGDTNLKTNNFIIETNKTEETTKEKLITTKDYKITAKDMEIKADVLNISGGSAKMNLSGSNVNMNSDKVNVKSKKIDQSGDLHVGGKIKCDGC